MKSHTQEEREWEILKSYAGKSSGKVSLSDVAEWLKAHDARLRASYVKEVREKADALLEVHRHDSIPCLTSGLEDGCSTCKRNHIIQEVTNSILSEKEGEE